MYFVFDCTSDGESYAFSTPYRWVAHLGAIILTKTTRRFHDYANMAGGLG